MPETAVEKKTPVKTRHRGGASAQRKAGSGARPRKSLKLGQQAAGENQNAGSLPAGQQFGGVYAEGIYTPAAAEAQLIASLTARIAGLESARQEVIDTLMQRAMTEYPQLKQVRGNWVPLPDHSGRLRAQRQG